MKPNDDVYPITALDGLPFKRHSLPSTNVTRTCEDHVRRKHATLFDNIETSLNGSRKNDEKTNARRHSWSFSSKSKETMYSTVVISGQSSRRSSTSSVAEVIEECASDEELDNEYSIQNNNTGHSSINDYIHCINCSRNDSNSSLDSTNSLESSTPLMNYCYNCKHLRKNNTLLQTPAFSEPRKLYLTSIDSIGSNSPRRSRRGSVVETLDLPVITEPSFDEDANDTNEMKLLVEQEVHKLLGFNRGEQ